MPKGRVTQRFQDKETKLIYVVGDEYQTKSAKRLNELVTLGFISKPTTLKGDGDA
jgi:hypothetical protein